MSWSCVQAASMPSRVTANPPSSSTTGARSSPPSARQVLVDRLGIITEQAPPYAPSAKGTVESLFRWMTQHFERRLPNTSYGTNDASTAAIAGGMTPEELERCFIQAIVDDYQQDWDELRRQWRSVLWEHAAAQSGVPQYLGSPDDLKLLLPFRKDIFIETAFEQRFQAMLRSAWRNRSWHVIVADPGAGKTMGIRDLVKTAGSRAILAVVAPKNNEDEMALGNQFFTALGLPLRGRWCDRKPHGAPAPVRNRVPDCG